VGWLEHIEADKPINFVWSPDHETKEIRFRILTDMPIVYSCIETHTYVLRPEAVRESVLDDSYLDIIHDLHLLNNTPLPFGQIAFFSYYQNGEFIMEAATDRFKPHLIEQAFESFGYKEVKLERNFITVSKKDQFKLKLQHGH